MKRQQDSLAERLMNAGFIPVPWIKAKALGKGRIGQLLGSGSLGSGWFDKFDRFHYKVCHV